MSSSLAVTSVPMSASDISDWVRPDEGLVLSGIYADSEIFAMEIERIWKKSWLWAGHESEVPQVGDFLTRTVGTVAIIITRTKDGDVVVLENRCTHRGNLLCTQDHGNASIFRCAYHGWSFRNDGELLGVPYKASYGDKLDEQSWGLVPVARQEVYRGMVFISHSPAGPSLLGHMGNAKEPLDRFMDASPVGRLRFDVGFNRMRLDANWKMYIENASDNYHANFVHVSAFSSPEQREISAAISRDASLAIVRSLGNGHAEMDFRPEQRAKAIVMHTGNASAVASEAETRYLAALTESYGAERATEIVADGPPYVFMFPNLFVIQQDMRRIEPVSPGKSHLYQHPAMLDGVPEEINVQRLSRHEAAYGAAGFVMSDDFEVFARTQRAAESNDDGWLRISRGLDREVPHEHGGVYSHVTDETGIRGMWHQYVKMMAAGDDR